MKRRVFLLAWLIILTISATLALAQSLQQLKTLAERGNRAAQSRLGEMYAAGQGVKQDYAQAKLWYEKAAAQGNAVAQVNLGVLYATGQGVKQDYAQAKLSYEKAAAQGDAPAHNNLGFMYQ